MVLLCGVGCWLQACRRLSMRNRRQFHNSVSCYKYAFVLVTRIVFVSVSTSWESFVLELSDCVRICSQYRVVCIVAAKRYEICTIHLHAHFSTHQGPRTLCCQGLVCLRCGFCKTCRNAWSVLLSAVLMCCKGLNSVALIAQHADSAQ